MIRDVLRRVVADRTGITGRVRVDVHDVSHLKRAAYKWDTLSKDEHYELVQEFAPVESSFTTNTTVEGLHKYHVDDLDQNQSPTNLDVTHLGVGTDGTAPTSSNTSLNSETNRYALRSTTDNTNDLQTTTFIDTGEENGNTLKEVGLFSASSGGTMFNHALISDVIKNNTKTVTITVTLEYRAA